MEQRIPRCEAVDANRTEAWKKKTKTNVDQGTMMVATSCIRDENPQLYAWGELRAGRFMGCCRAEEGGALVEFCCKFNSFMKTKNYFIINNICIINAF